MNTDEHVDDLTGLTPLPPLPVHRERGMRRREGALRPDQARRRVSGADLKVVKVLKVLMVLNF
jgi:hypothetical protein